MNKDGRCCITQEGEISVRGKYEGAKTVSGIVEHGGIKVLWGRICS